MRTLRTAIIGSLTCLAIVAIVHADTKMAVPPPQPGSARLTAALVGSWSGDAQLQETNKPGVKLRVKIDCREASGGWGVRCEASMASPESTYLESDLFGYEPSSDQVHWYAVTSAGEVHDHVGTWSGDHRLSVRYVGKAGTDDLTEDVQLDFSGGKQMSFSSATMVAGAAAATVHGSLTRSR